MSDFNKEKLMKLIKDSRVQWAAVIVIFLIIFVLAMQIRTANLPILVDPTSGKAATSDLDAYYWLRMTKILYYNGSLPKVDDLRSPGQNISFAYEKMPQFTVFLYKLVKPFNSGLQIDTFAMMAPAIFFAMGFILFFILVYLLSGSKLVSILSAGLLAFTQGYLFRSMSGVFDHDVLGEAAIFLCFIFLYLGLKNISSWKKSTIYSVLTGITTTLVVSVWGGALTFVLLVLPFAIFVKYLYHTEKEDKIKYIIFMLIWMIVSVLFCFVVNLPTNAVLGRFKESLGIIVPFVLTFIIIDYALDYIKVLKENKYLKYQKLTALIITIVLGIIALTVIGKDIFSVFGDIWFRLIYPFGLGRLSVTVAENAQPHLIDWFAQYSKVIVALFAAGSIAIGIDSTKNFEKKQRIIFSSLWILMIASALLSRISDASFWNGENFMSEAFYFIGLAAFFVYFLYLSFTTDKKIDARYSVMLSLILFTLINGRSAARSFFLITPFIVFAASYLVWRLFDLTGWRSESNASAPKSKEWKYAAAIAFVVLLIFSLGTIRTDFSSAKTQSKYMGPSEGPQWDQAMAWVRNNTGQRDVFVHWWDYGYWVQTIGERPTVTDGGHSGGDQADHYTGRYILTTPNPKTAFSYMKTWNVSYLLIDPTELGKYAAYSRIGSNEDWDRYSVIPIGAVDQTQIQETSTGEKRIYQLGGIVDGDISYNGTFLPGPTFDQYGRASFKSYILGALLEIQKSNQTVDIKQPTGIYSYNGKQVSIPLRYVYFGGKLIDFRSGLEAGVVIIPQVSANSQGGVSIDQIGGMIYLSPKVYPSLYAQLYLMNDPQKLYPTIKIADSQDDVIVAALKSQTTLSSDMILYNGFRAPLKIWKVEYPTNTPTYPHFFDANFTYGGMDKYFS